MLRGQVAGAAAGREGGRVRHAVPAHRHGAGRGRDGVLALAPRPAAARGADVQHPHGGRACDGGQGARAGAARQRGLRHEARHGGRPRLPPAYGLRAVHGGGGRRSHGGEHPERERHLRQRHLRRAEPDVRREAPRERPGDGGQHQAVHAAPGGVQPHVPQARGVHELRHGSAAQGAHGQAAAQGVRGRGGCRAAGRQRRLHDDRAPGEPGGVEEARGRGGAAVHGRAEEGRHLRGDGDGVRHPARGDGCGGRADQAADADAAVALQRDGRHRQARAAGAREVRRGAGGGADAQGADAARAGGGVGEPGAAVHHEGGPRHEAGRPLRGAVRRRGGHAGRVADQPGRGVHRARQARAGAAAGAPRAHRGALGVRPLHPRAHGHDRVPPQDG
mmetsp:Transcript_13908/g.47957  ORF Transcript_13908/g.47957 Transcript_13908/m.47957 type:complete len:390 (+) Transcript_13908:329-1498(+)